VIHNKFILPIGYRVHYISQNRIWTSYKNNILVSEDEGTTFVKYKSFHSVFSNLFQNSRLCTRLIRGGIHELINTNSSLITVIPYYIIRATNSNDFEIVHRFKNGTRPLNILQTPDNFLYFGEYFNNTGRQEVCIYGSYDEGKTWSIVYTFPKNTIRHIHKLIYDPFRKGILILTGDEDHESSILLTKDNFKTIETIISGNQDARAVSLIPIQQGLIIPTDTPLKQNYIQHFDFTSEKLTKLCEIPGSSFYSISFGGKYFVSTGVEPSKVNISPYATLWGSTNGFDWQLLFKAKKDKWDPHLFQYGNIILPRYESDSKYLFSTMIGLECYDNKTIRWKLL